MTTIPLSEQSRCKLKLKLIQTELQLSFHSLSNPTTEQCDIDCQNFEQTSIKTSLTDPPIKQKNIWTKENDDAVTTLTEQ